MRNFKRLLAALTAIAAVCGTTACGSSSGSSDTEGEETSRRISSGWVPITSTPDAVPTRALR